MSAALQISLLGWGDPAFDPQFKGATRVELDATTWVERLPGWVEGHAGLMAQLVGTTRWQTIRRRMYERTVDVPRLMASLPGAGEAWYDLARGARRGGARTHRVLSTHANSNEEARRQALLDHARRINELGVNQGKSGNLSVRCPSGRGFLITPSGVEYETMRPEDLVFVRWDGEYEVGAGHGVRPSTEWRLHRDIYQRRAEAAAIVHAHAMFATTLSCLDRGIPAFHYMVAMAGGVDIRCAPYATFGTQELSDAALAALDGRTACLHAHHGMTVFAGALPAAVALAVEVETLAAMYWRALQLGSPAILSHEEMGKVLARFEGYGRAAKP